MASSSTAPPPSGSSGQWDEPLELARENILKQLRENDIISADNEEQALVRITASLNELIKPIQAQFQSLRADNNSLQTANNTLNNEIGRLQDRLSSGSRERIQLQNRVKELEEQVTRQDERMTRQREEQQGQLRKIDYENEQKAAEISDLKEKVAEAEAAVNAIDEDKDFYITNLEEQNEQLEAQLNDERKELERLTQDLKDANLSIENDREFMEKFHEDQKAGEALTKRYNELSERHVELQKRQQTSNEAIEAMKQDMMIKDVEIRQLQKEAAEAVEAAQAAQAAQESNDEKRKDSKASSVSGGQIPPGDSLGAELEAASKTMELEETITELREEIEALQGQIKVPADVSALQKKIKGLQKQIKELERIVADQNSAIDAADVRNLEMETALGPDFGKGGPTYAEVAAERNDLQKKLDKANAKVDDLTKQSRDIRSLQSKVAALEKRERELQAQLKAKASGSPAAKGSSQAPAAAAAAASKNEDLEKVDAALKECESDRKRLASQLAQLNRELEHERRQNEILQASDESDGEKDRKKQVADLKERIAQLEQQLADTLKAKGGDSTDRIAALERQLAEMTEELGDARAARERAVARVTELEAGRANPAEDDEGSAQRIAHLEERIQQLQQSRVELADYMNNQMAETSANARRAIESHAEQLRAYHEEQEQAARQMDSVNARIAANPGEATAARRRATFLEAEIRKLVNRIKALQDESRWFEDLARASQDAQARTEEALQDAWQAAAAGAERAREAGENAMDRARINIARLRRGANNAEPGQPPRPAPAAAAPARPGWFGNWRFPRVPGFPGFGPDGVGARVDPAARRTLALLYHPFLLFVIFCMFVVHGREYAIYRNSNPLTKRAVYANMPDRWAVCVAQPAWPLVWEFFAMVFSGSWIWSEAGQVPTLPAA
ncbi:hypothetical protein Hte_009158 [Hypoxylon texense]